MNKDNTMFRTMEIKSQIIASIDDPFDKMTFYIKDDNLKKFMEIWDKCKIALEAKDEIGNTLLNLAVQANSYDISNFLIIMGAKVNTQNVLIYYLV
jgi:hypothetical protein